MQKSTLAIAVASLLSYTSFSYASDVETVVVTANRFEQQLKDTIAQIDIITKEDIKQTQAVSLDEVLQRLSGVQLITNGYGKTPEIYVRGTSSRHQLVLINGVRVGSATLGSTDLSSVPLTGIERIEVIKGSRAALYGTDAIGGVINIITSSNKSDSSREVSVGLGSNGYRRGGASVSGNIGDANWGKIAVTTEANNGFSSLPQPYEQDEDGFRSSNVVLELGRTLSDDLDVRLQGYYNKGKSEYDSGGLQAPTYTVWGNDPGRYSEFENYNLAGKVNLSRDSYSSELTLAQNQDNSVNKDSSGYNSLFETDRTAVNWIHHYQIDTEFALGGGLEWQKEKVSTSGDSYTDDERSSKAVYLNSTYKLERWLLEGSVRTDDSDSYGRNNTWQLGFESDVAELLSVGINLGTAYKAPTFNDLYYPEDSWGNKGNSDVKPEESKYAEVTLLGSSDMIEWKISAYRTEIDELISWVYDSSTYSSTPENIDSAIIKGAELQLVFALGSTDHELSYDYIDAKDDSTGKELKRRSMHSAKWNISYQRESWLYELSARYKGSSFNNDANTQALDAYTLFDVATSYQITDDLVIRGRVTNLLDHDYVSKIDYNGYAYNSAGRELYLNMDYTF